MYSGLCCVSACRVQCDMLPCPQGVQPCAVQCAGLTSDFAREQGFLWELASETLCETAHVPVQDCTQTSGPGAVVLFAAGMPPAVGGYSARPRDSRVVAGLVSETELVWCALGLVCLCACQLAHPGCPPDVTRSWSCLGVGLAE